MQVRVEVRYVFSHMVKWKILGKEVAIDDLGAIIVFSKHPGPQEQREYNFTMKEEPYHFNCADLERFLAALSFFLYVLHKRKDVTVEDHLGEFLYDVFKKAGIMQKAPA